jgi:hypothetical protein
MQIESEDQYSNWQPTGQESGFEVLKGGVLDCITAGKASSRKHIVESRGEERSYFMSVFVFYILYTTMS